MTKTFLLVSLSLNLVFVALFQKDLHLLLVYVESCLYLLEKYVPVLQSLL